MICDDCEVVPNTNISKKKKNDGGGSQSHSEIKMCTCLVRGVVVTLVKVLTAHSLGTQYKKKICRQQRGLLL